MAVRRRGDDARRRQLIAVAIECLSEVGLAGATLSQIAGRAGVSPGLIAHYFDDKDGLLEAAFRRLSAQVHAAAKRELAQAQSPKERVLALVEALLSQAQFDRPVASAWLAFWAAVPHSPVLKRVQSVYQRRMLSNLRHALVQCLPKAEAHELSKMIAAMIDGVWLRAALSDWQEVDSFAARRLLTRFINGYFQAASTSH
jgi:betaine-aldehyde dehydrogenase